MTYGTRVIAVTAIWPHVTYAWCVRETSNTTKIWGKTVKRGNVPPRTRMFFRRVGGRGGQSA